MFTLPTTVKTQVQELLQQHTIPPRTQVAYLKWLRYYWDFCHKYHFPPEQRASLPHFLKKLHDKKQTTTQQEQAAHAIELYYALLDTKASTNQSPSPQEASSPGKAPSKSTEPPPGSPSTSSEQALQGENSAGSSQRGNSSGGEKAPPESSELSDSMSCKARTGRGASWKTEYHRLTETLQGRQYDPKVARAYMKWVRKFQAFSRSKAPDMLSSDDVRALCALVFLPACPGPGIWGDRRSGSSETQTLRADGVIS